LLQAVARLALERKCGRLEWAVLDWNRPSIEFYRRCGAEVMSEWLGCRMSADQMKSFTEGTTK
jgi:RimJ/RimL family protein N-acetyltransferase